MSLVAPRATFYTPAGMRLKTLTLVFFLVFLAGPAWSCGTTVANGGLHFALLRGPILGRGNSGIVQRVSEEEGHRFEKGFFSKSRFDRETMQSIVTLNGKANRDSDLTYFKLLKQLEKAGLKVGPRIPEVSAAEVEIDGQKLPGLHMKGDFDGRDVLSLVNDKSLDEALRNRILENYASTLKQLQTFFELECEGVLRKEIMESRIQFDAAVYPKYRLPFLEMQFSTFHRKEPGLPSLSTSLHIAADGFIVDARTLEIWLVAPN